MNKDHTAIGNIGENIASDFLIKNNYEIVKRNFRVKKLELDIICKKNNLLIVVEVKTRTNNRVLTPELAVTKSKQKKIIEATNSFVIENKIDMEVRFDIISVELNQSKTIIRHIKSAFYPLI